MNVDIPEAFFFDSFPFDNEIFLMKI